MPKRSIDASALAMSATNERGAPPVKIQKTERSHEENQERAYIAASRRADRSLEARVQSAKMASEIHRRRTGRGLKVNEEIVVKEEMYEEEDDDLPRHYKYLTAHLQTNSPEMNNRVSAYISTQAAMATIARYNEVNRLFNESFPSAAAMQQQFSSSMYMQPFMNGGGDSAEPSSPQASPITVQPTPAQIPTTASKKQTFVARQAPTTKTANTTSPPPLSPGSTATAPVESRRSPYATAFPELQIDPQLMQHQRRQQTSSSAFTSELPNEVKMMANIDMSDPMASHFFGGNFSGYPSFGQFSGPSYGDNSAQAATPTSPTKSVETDETAIFSPVEGSMGFFDVPSENYSRYGTPGGPIGDGWETFVDFEQ